MISCGENAEREVALEDSQARESQERANNKSRRIQIRGGVLYNDKLW
jgi:hypothetical protein